MHREPLNYSGVQVERVEIVGTWDTGGGAEDAQGHRYWGKQGAGSQAPDTGEQITTPEGAHLAPQLA